MTPTLNLLVLCAADLDAAAQFYAALGMTFARHRHGAGPEHRACEQAGFVFELYPRREGALSTKATRLGFRVESVAAAVAALEAAGGTVVHAPENSPWGLRAVVSDPDGHTIELTESQGAEG